MQSRTFSEELLFTRCKKSIINGNMGREVRICYFLELRFELSSMEGEERRGEENDDRRTVGAF